jgi:hypothetical protein
MRRSQGFAWHRPRPDLASSPLLPASGIEVDGRMDLWSEGDILWPSLDRGKSLPLLADR